MSREIKDLLVRVKPLVHQPGVGDLLHLLSLYVEEWKEDLIITNDEKTRGAIIKVRGIINDLKRDTNGKQYKNGAYNGEGN